ncbi:Dimethyl sulfoxide/trimethylamine N-oxide reductase [Labeo rohita]|uniref:Dimethyl sulfoxide/trimethylamine N-oxide reductase n=1 Tax=Labeo rohita TaxID=84645 RepID=A0ABQ8LCQ1_LABRO|nr:Dimethyl sulfoxide/trimethylamine N-oxide reductase [Labeo rohita]
MCVEEEREEPARSACSPNEPLDDFESSSQYRLDLLFGAPAEEQAISAAPEGGRELPEADASSELTAPAASLSWWRILKRPPHFNWQPRRSEWCWSPRPAPSLLGWMTGSEVIAVTQSPGSFYPGSAQGVDKIVESPSFGLDHNIPTLCPSPPLIAVWRRGIRRSPRWRERLLCTSARKMPPPGEATRDSRPGLRRLTWPLVKPCPPCMPWLSCRSIKQGTQRSARGCSQPRATAGAMLYDYALRATKVMAQALGRAMPTMVVSLAKPWRSLRTAQTPQQASPAARPTQRSSSRRKVALPARPQATKNPRQASKGSSDGQPREGGSFDLSGSTLDEGTSAGFGSNLVQPHGESSAQFSLHEPTRQNSQWSLGLLTSIQRPFFQPQFPHSRTIRLGYAIHFMSRPPKYRGVLSTSVLGKNAVVLRAGSAVLLAKDAIETVPSVKNEERTQAIPTVCLRRTTYQYKVLPFGLSLLPREGTWISTTWLVWDFGSTAQSVQVNGPPETISEASGVHGILSRGHAAGSNAHETATTLASYPSPEMGMAPRHVSCEHHTIMPQDTQPLARHFVPAVRGALGTSVQMHHCHYRCFQDRMGCRVQWACSFRGLDRPPTALAHQLPGVVDSAFSPEKLARQLLLWSQHRLRSLHTTHIPSKSNHVADSLSQQVSLGGEWRLHPQSVQLIWSRFSQAQVDLFASPESTHCQLCEPHCTNPVQSQGGQGTDSLGGPVLAQQNLVFGHGAPSIKAFLAHSPEEGPPLSGEGHNLAPVPRSLEPPPMVPGHDQEDFRDLSLSVDPQRCDIESVLSFLQGGLDRHLSASTLKVHVAAISANHDLVDGRSALQQDPFEPLKSVELNALSLKTALLTALTSVKRVGDLQALSVNSSCLEFGSADSHVVLRPQPGYVPKVPTTCFRDQVVTLQAISSQEDEPNLTLLWSTLMW